MHRQLTATVLPEVFDHEIFPEFRLRQWQLKGLFARKLSSAQAKKAGFSPPVRVYKRTDLQVCCLRTVLLLC